VWENRETFWDETNKKLEVELSTLRAENERLQARLKEQADQYQELIAQLHRDVAERDGRFDAYRRKVRALVEAAANCIPDEGQVVTLDDLIQHLGELRAALAALGAEDD
jgi:predicted  nucleic acid-binding Zn-ribbon protein